MRKKVSNIIEDIFEIKDEYLKLLTKQEENYLEEIEEILFDLIEEEGEVGKPKIREIILDDLLKNNFINLINYLNIQIEDEIKETLDKKLTDDSFLKIEEMESKDDFFIKFLNDESLNDLIMTLYGYKRKAEGNKETFTKVISSIIPTKRISAINNVLWAMFNKINFVSNKEDEEQAKLLLLAYTRISDIILEINYECCDLQKTKEILGMVVIKLSNLIGFSGGYRKELLEALRESYKSLNQTSNKDKAMEYE